VIRELSLALCHEDAPEGYRNEAYCWEWERRHRLKPWRHLEFVHHRHERTQYQERGGE